uniref:MADS35 n=1 Tax=Apostasia odorata TaxID=280455 RepID=A0A1L1WL15_9ASPA|nr:MADS35 [Apostasia odorata]
MARKKVKLEWIANDSARRATLKKRRKGLLKKASELSTLCDVKACLILFAAGEPQPEVWPSRHEAARILAKLKRLPEMEQGKKMMNQEGFMRQRITKLQEQLQKQERENRELETTLLMYQGLMGKTMSDVSIKDLTGLAWLIELKVNQVRKRLDALRKNATPPPQQQPAAAAVAVKKENASPQLPQAAAEKTALEVAMEELQKQDWFSEIMMNPLAAHEEMMGHHLSFLELAGSGVGGGAWPDAYFPVN